MKRIMMFLLLICNVLGAVGSHKYETVFGWGDCCVAVPRKLDALGAAIQKDNFSEIKKLVDGGFVVKAVHFVYAKCREEGLLKDVDGLSDLSEEVQAAIKRKIRNSSAGLFFFLSKHVSEEESFYARTISRDYLKESVDLIESMEKKLQKKFSLSWFIDNEES